MNNVVLPEKVYNWLKWLVTVVFPAASALYVGLAALYGWGSAEQVAGTLALLTVFMGSILNLSARNYRNSDAPYEGAMVVTTSEEGTKKISLELTGDPHDIAEMKTVSFKVRDEQDYMGMELG